MKAYANRKQFIIHLVRFPHIWLTCESVAVLQTGWSYLFTLIVTFIVFFKHSYTWAIKARTTIVSADGPKKKAHITKLIWVNPFWNWWTGNNHFQ